MSADQEERPEVSIREFGDVVTPDELEAELLDNGDLEGHYGTDERNVALYDGLRYSEPHGEWVARFVPANPEGCGLTHDDATYSETLRRAQLLHTCSVKPSQSLKALRAFAAKLDREVAKLDFPNPES